MTSPTTRPRAYWALAGVRVIWLALTALVVVIFVLGLDAWYPQAIQPCTDTALACRQQLRVGPEDAALLASQGWSLIGYATYSLGLLALSKALGVALGVLIFWRRPVDRMALVASLFLVIGLGTDVADALVSVQPAWWLPAQVLALIGSICFALFFYIFPTGSFVPRWTRWLTVVWAAIFAGIFFFPDSPLNLNKAPLWVAGPMLIALVGSFIVAPIYRYRTMSTYVERLQTKWVVFATVLGMAGLILSLLSVVGRTSPGHILQPYWILTSLGFQLNSIVLPLAIALSILRYRLFDIDVLIRRTLVYSALSALLALAYFGSVLVLQNVFQAVTGESRSALVTVLSTLTIAALFGPLRGRVQRAIDRRFYRQKYDAARTLAAFGAQARDVVELEQLSDQLIAAVDETMQPAHVGLWVRKELGR